MNVCDTENYLTAADLKNVLRTQSVISRVLEHFHFMET